MAGLQALRGNLSGSRLAGRIVLSDPYAVLQVVATRHVPSAESIIGALIVFLFFALIAGRAFCSWVCPMNIISDAAIWFRRKAAWSGAGLKISRDVRFWVCGLGIGLSALTGMAAFEWVSPVSMFHRGLIFGMGFGWLIVAAVFVLDLVVVENGFCGHICPLGAFYSVVTRFRLLRIFHDRSRCTRCMRCIEACPEAQVLPMIGERSGLVESGECTNCGRCIEICENQAMSFTLATKHIHSRNHKEE